MGQKKKEYFGGIETEIEAARLYDEASVKANGLKVNLKIFINQNYRLKQTLIIRKLRL